MLGLGVALAIFSIVVLVVCLRAPLRRKAWWAEGILVGIGQLRFDWTSGAFDLVPVAVQLLSASFEHADPVAPFVLSVSFPLFRHPVPAEAPLG